MSTDYDLYCRSCDDALGLDCARYWMAETLLPMAKAMAGSKGLPTCDVQISGHYVDLQWMADHGAHDLVLRSEYGECVDECGEYFACEACGHQRKCLLRKAHDGAHCETRPK